MNTLSLGRIIGIDASQDWLDVHCAMAIGNDARTVRMARPPWPLSRERSFVVCFEATGGQEWKLWVALDVKGSSPVRCRPPR